MKKSFSKGSLIIMMLRVPETLPKFNNYINSIAPFLNAIDPDTGITNAERLGVTTADLTKINNLLQKWQSAYMLHTDASTKSKTTRVKVKDIMKDFTKFFSPVLNRVNGSPNCKDEDRMELNIAIKKPSSRKKTKIKDIVVDMAQQLGGGEILITCRVDSDEGRPCIHPLAHGWFIAYDIVDPNFENTSERFTKVKKESPQSPDECYNHGFYSRAKDVLKTGAEHKGRILAYYIRWFDHKNQELSGPYGPKKEIIIL